MREQARLLGNFRYNSLAVRSFVNGGDFHRERASFSTVRVTQMCLRMSRDVLVFDPSRYPTMLSRRKIDNYRVSGSGASRRAFNALDRSA